MITIHCLILYQQQYKIQMFLIYGLKNCDSCLKALQWMKAEHFECTFSDLRGGEDVLNLVKGWVSVCGWITLLNKRGSTWRKLGGGRKDDLKEDTAVALMVEFPALIKRPIFVWNRNVIVGFKKEQKDEIIRLATQR